ncbi:MAG: transposase [Patescibacteria group bacterium]|jgi:putative transposase
MLHRNSQKRIYFPDAIYFVTIVVQNRFPFFKEEIFCELFIDDLKYCKNLKKFNLYGFVILFDHVHLLIRPGDKYNISQILHNLKRTSSLHINEMIKSSDTEGEDIYPRLRCHWNGRLKFQWQKSFFDRYIRNDNDFNYHLEYIRWNPQKHKIINNFKDYKYSSGNYCENLIDNFD